VLVTRRDGDHIIGLPLVSGGATQHMHHPYFPIPFSRGMLEGVPDGTAPVLVPRLTVADGSQLMPLAFIRDVKIATVGRTTTVAYRQTELDRIGRSTPVADDRIGVQTTYTLEPNRIARRDVFMPRAALDISGVRLEFAGFSTDGRLDGTIVRFGSGAVTTFRVEGLGQCELRTLNRNHDYESDTGAMTALVACTAGPMRLERPLTIAWDISYR